MEIEPSNQVNSRESSSELKRCKICLCDESEGDSNDINDKMINLCKCKGSCEFMHYKCFKKCIEYKKLETHKFMIQLNNCIGYNLKKLYCELCNSSLPFTIKIDDQEIEIIEIDRPKQSPYIILERIESIKDCRALFVLQSDGANDLKIVIISII